jgi:membrane fusion protein, multidrug efflux system
MQLETLKGVTIVPSSAVQRGSPGTFVYRVNDDNTVSVRVVKLGPTEGETTVIESGVAPGERVVTDGADKLREGARIEPITAEQRAAPAAGARRGEGRGGAARGDPSPARGAPAPATSAPGAPGVVR